MKEVRLGDQPLPVKNDTVDVQSLVLDDIRKRRELGVQRYGTALQINNGRNMLLDAYEEALDLAIYLRGFIEEQKYNRLHDGEVVMSSENDPFLYDDQGGEDVRIIDKIEAISVNIGDLLSPKLNYSFRILKSHYEKRSVD